jgi:hypothetical protein
MGLFDDTRPKLDAGPESWIDRVRGEIGFTSPSGKQYTAKWVEDSRSKQKRLQMTDYLEKKHTKVRDLEIASTMHPIVFFFDGNDCDKTSEEFWKSCDEVGEWEVLHPVNGFKSYQLISVSQKNSYVNSGGVVEFSTEWIEPQDFNPTESGRKLKSMADYHRAKLKENSALSFAEKLKLGTEALRKHASNISSKVAGISYKRLGPIAAMNDFAYESFLTTQRMVRDIELSTVYQGRMLAGQLQNLIDIGLKSTTDPFSRNRAYNEMVSDIIGEGFTTVSGKTEVSISKDEFGINKALILQLSIESCIGSLCEIASSSEIYTKSDGVSIIENMLSQLDEIYEQLDTIQNDISSGSTIDNGFVGFEDTISDILDSVSASIKYVLYVISKSKIRKKTVLQDRVTTIKFFLNKYKTIDGFFDFCDRNNLSGGELFMLPAGKEIQV